MTQLHAGGKFDQNSYKVSGGLHGVGVSVVNALSDWLDLRIWREGYEHYARFEGGDTVESLRRVGPAGGERGTEVRFLASTETFSNLDYSFKTLEHRLRELAFLNSGVRITPPRRAARRGRGGGARLRGRGARVRALPRPVEDAADQGRRSTSTARRRGIGVEVAMWWNDSYYETVLPFTNNIPQRDGGTHLAGFRGALTRTINAYAGESRAGEEGEGRALGRRRARGADLRPLGQGAGPEVLEPDQGQARQLRGAPGGREPGRREARRVVRGEPGRGEGRRRQDRRGGDRARGGAQGARADPAQDGDGRREPAGQARRLPGEGPVEGRDLHRRGRLAPAGRRSRGGAAPTRRCCRSAARSSTSSGRASTGC